MDIVWWAWKVLSCLTGTWGILSCNTWLWDVLFTPILEIWWDLTRTWLWVVAILIFFIWYYFIATEEKYHLNKAKPALMIWTLMFVFIGFYYMINGLDFEPLHHWLSELILEIAEIYFFLFVAMTFIETLIERRVFEVLKHKLVSSWWTYKKIFWGIWFVAFFLSPIADNLTTALVLSTVLLNMERKKINFIVPTAINIIVAANAWWAWSPFGDITTLMAWTAGKWEFLNFLYLFPASFTWYVVTCLFLSRFVPKWKPIVDSVDWGEVKLKYGWKWVIFLGIFTIVCAVVFHQFFHFPAMWGMMFWLATLKMYAYFLNRRSTNATFDVYASMRLIENDTLLFFFGILSAVWALHYIGFLQYIVELYDWMWSTPWNVIVWFVSAIIDNVPVMNAVLKADPSMWLDQWLLLTLTVWIGGSLISFGSAAWVWVMWKLKGIYTFSTHMKYAWTILVGYVISVLIRYIQFEMFGWY